MNDNVLVLGLGYVGLTLSSVVAKYGKNVYGIDINESIINTINDKKGHFYEEGLDSTLEQIVNKNFFVANNVDAFKSIKFKTIIITVGTPLVDNSKIPNFNFIESAIKSLNNVYDGTQLIILRSTVAVGTTRKIIIPKLLKLISNESNAVKISFCPERTVEGKALKELVELPQIISGNTEQSINESREFFHTFNKDLIIVESLEAAELVKLFNNTYRDINFAVGNIFNNIAQNFGLNGLELIESSNHNYPRSNIAKPGLVGGPCLEKDPYILVSNIAESIDTDFILNSRNANEALEEKVVNWVKSNNPNFNEIFVSGIAFKGTPETSDLRGSPSLSIVKKLFSLGYKLSLHDFCVPLSDLEKLNTGMAPSEFNENLKKFNMILILTNHKSYIDHDILAYINENVIVLDYWKNYSKITDNRIKTIGNYEIN
jgi:UDP-N-acetyl-D-mannosaminuronic acid dehydrogenase